MNICKIVAEKVHMAGENRDGNVMYCKMYTKTKKSNGSPRAEISKIQRSFVLLFVPRGRVHMLNYGLKLLVFCWLCEPRTHYSLFLGGSLFQRLKAKCERFTVNFLEFTDMT